MRLTLRGGGGVGALVRLLRGDCEASVQAAAAGALSLLAARDIVIQDSVRYLVGAGTVTWARAPGRRGNGRRGLRGYGYGYQALVVQVLRQQECERLYGVKYHPSC